MDLIDRQAALDALRDRYYKYDRFAKIEELVWAIEALPSAQPDVPDINVGDMISRQAAISEIMEELEDRSLHDDPATPEDYAEGYDEGIRNAAATVLQMPSAQPEPIRLRIDHELSKEEYERLKKDCAEQPIILLPKESAQPREDIRAMCGECDAWNQYKNHPQPGWIPCSERLPGEEESFYVLCCDKHGEIMVGNVFACDDGETPYSAESEYEYMYDCVAWMPLPKPWEGGQDDT